MGECFKHKNFHVCLDSFKFPRQTFEKTEVDPKTGALYEKG